MAVSGVVTFSLTGLDRWIGPIRPTEDPAGLPYKLSSRLMDKGWNTKVSDLRFILYSKDFHPVVGTIGLKLD
jgi:hypothetical protein